MLCASFKIMADSLKQNSLLRYLRTSDNEKEVQRKRKELSNAFSEKETEELSASKKTRAEAELSKPKQNARSMRTFQTQKRKNGCPMGNLVQKLISNPEMHSSLVKKINVHIFSLQITMTSPSSSPRRS